MSANNEKPIILLVHGAWHQPIHYRRLIAPLQDQGFTVVAPPLASSGYDDSIDTASHVHDMQRIHDSILRYIERGKVVVAIGHSYGAIPLSEAILGHTIADRAARGLAGGFKSVVYIAPLPAFDQGVSLYEAGGRQWIGAWFHTSNDTRLPLKMDKAPDAFFPDVEQSIRDECMSSIAQQSFLAFDTPITSTAVDLDIPKTLLVCANDTVFPKELQHLVAEKWKATPIELPSGHSPWLSGTKERLVQIIVEEALRE